MSTFPGREGWLPEGTLIGAALHDPSIKPKLNRPKVAAGKDVYTLALERTEYILDNHDRAAVAFSGGKDSTSVLNVTLEVLEHIPRLRRHLPLRVVHFDEEAIPFETEEYVRRVAQRDDVALEWYCLPVRHRNACSRRSPFWWPWAPEDEAKWCRPLPPEAITTHPGFPLWPQEARMSIPEFNGPLCPPPHNTAMLMGIRAQESLIRSSAVRRRSVDNYINEYKEGLAGEKNIWKAYPIYDWRADDVWAAVRIKGWDYNRAYDRMEAAGIPYSAQRCSPAFGEEPLQKISAYAKCFPEVWERMAERVPGIGAAYRYALTELYGYGSRPPKPEGMTWPDFLAHYIRKHDPVVQRSIAKRIRKSVRRHYRNTLDPILPNNVHPMTGLDWKFLHIIAMRGDFKERRQETSALQGSDRRKLWRAYVDALTKAIADGVPPVEYGHGRDFPSDPEALIPPEYR